MVNKRFMVIAMCFMFLTVSMGAVSAANSTTFSNVNMFNSGVLKVNIDDPLALQGTISFKGIQFDDKAAIKIKWTDLFPGATGNYFVNLKIDYLDNFGDMETDYEEFFVENGTISRSETVTIPYMDLSKVASITVTADDYNWGLYEPVISPHF